MKTTHSYSIDRLYTNLGKLFYAIAAADKNINSAEIKALKDFVQKEWLKVDDLEDEFGTDAAYQIEIMFDLLMENPPEAADAFQDFKDFKARHENLFSAEIKKLTWKTADAIAAAFAGKNKSEVIMLSKLKAILKS
ncbi:hypothetical protein ACW6QP_05950 [Salegentibacter sp. HM20]